MPLLPSTWFAWNETTSESNLAKARTLSTIASVTTFRCSVRNPHSFIKGNSDVKCTF